MNFPTELQSIVVENEPLAGHTWLRIGGEAKYFAAPTSRDQLVLLVQFCHSQSIPLRLLGGGSNLLVREQGFDGCVISLDAPEFCTIQCDETRISCSGGAKLSHLVTHSVGNSLAGLEHLVAIPGTIGGAVHGNSGTRDGSIGDRISSASVLDRTGQVSSRTKDELQFGTNQSSLDELVVLDVQFELEKSDASYLTQKMQKHWIVRRAQQPAMQTAAVIPFVEPDITPAADLIDQAGMRGHSEGLVKLSNDHPNFLVANEGATSDQVISLLETVREKVQTSTGTQLQIHLTIW